MPAPTTSKRSSKSAGAKSADAKSTENTPAKSSAKSSAKSGKSSAKSSAPKFALDSDAGTRVKLADYAGKWLVVYFYPKDNTPGCTREAQDFTQAAPKLKKLGAEVVGISKDSVKSHCGFKDKIGIRFPLLSDPDLSTHKAYGAWGTKTMYGKKVEGTIRSTFLVSPAGKIARSWTSVKVDGHAEKVIAALEELKGGDPS
jgi:thioredoxin-dependent peroxiredoxin